MSIGGQIQHAFHHAAHEVQSGAKDAVHSAKHDIVNPAGRAVDKVGDEIEKIVHAGDQQIRRLTDHTGVLLKQAGDEIKKDLDQGFHAVVETLTSEAVHQGLTLAEKTLSFVDHELGAFAKSHPKLVDHINQTGDSIVLGPVTLNYSQFYTRADAMLKVIRDTLRDGWKLTRHFIIDLITALAPTSIDINATIEFFSTFGDKLKNLPVDVFVAIADKVLEKLGVPA